MAAYSATVLEGPGLFRTREFEELEVPDGWAVLRVSYTGICGSDFAIVDGAHPRVSFPLVMGHEIAATVEDPGLSGLSPGDVVTVNPLISCGSCGACSLGSSHLCRNLKLLGIDAQGSMASHIAVPPAQLVPFKSGVDLVHAALAEPLAVAVHAVRRAQLVRNEQVLVFGAGTIGLLVGLVARHEGASSITVVEPSSERREAATSLGFSAIDPAEIITARDAGDTVPGVLFDCAGHHSVAALLPQTAPVRGRIVIVAVYHEPVPFDLRELAFAEQEVIGVRVYSSEDFAAAVALIESEALGLERLPVAVFPLNRAADAFHQARASGAAVKILLKSD